MSMTRILSRTALAATACLAAWTSLSAAAPEAPVTDAATLATLDRVLAGKPQNA